MSAAAIEIPLFPLNVVLFPGMVLPLHIFEPRYRQMITECSQTDKPFGIVLAQPGSVPMLEVPYTIGTMAEIRDLDRLEDGRFTLIALGTQRFRILSQHREKPYLSGFVEVYKDIEEPTEEVARYAKQAYALFSNYLELLLEAIDQHELQTALPEVPEDLSYFIAYFLDIVDEQKQQFLEMTSTLLRLQEEITILRREVPFVRQMLLNKAAEDDHSMLN
ncbi:MAG TPA: LON peptidase substrate-binding domain-containing protein [Ktedonobacteraceae bacterium]|nr:LON peptidase substrate-binding domain-containing protein [Ktedonobacteraceae bacterium]